MGILGVLKNLSRIKRYFQLFSKQIQAILPDTIIFIDYGGFNLKAAKIAKLLGFHTQFYIAPKVWAWNFNRIYTIKKWIDELYVIFPFEEKLFKDHKIQTTYVGNPLMDQISAFKKDDSFTETIRLPNNYIALLPGSRKQEINSLLPVFKELVVKHPSHQFVIAGVDEFIENFNKIGIPTVYNQTYQVISNAKLAIVCSGTATLETALLNTPLIVVYKTDPIFYRLAKFFVKVKYISLVNIILNKLSVPELIQNNLNFKNISFYLNALIKDNSIERTNQLKDFKELRELIGNKGASERAAVQMIKKAKIFSNN
jgi:lipid-A-disaccharide synthase